jgi:hypothetical protein
VAIVLHVFGRPYVVSHVEKSISDDFPSATSVMQFEIADVLQDDEGRLMIGDKRCYLVE